MSRLFEALSSLEARFYEGEADSPPAEPYPLEFVPLAAELFPCDSPRDLSGDAGTTEETSENAAATEDCSGLQLRPSAESRLVAWSDPNSLGAEKFRALVTRFDHLRRQHEFKSVQVTSSSMSEGKTLVAGNLAVTLAKYSGCKTLLVEGDLHRPRLGSLLGLRELRGLSHWWFRPDEGHGPAVHRLRGLPLWFLPAGRPCERPSDMLRSARFAEVIRFLVTQFDWIIVDSPPMQPVVDVNLWSQWLDGTLLVVREGVTVVKALKRALRALDQPKLIGVVVNEAAEFDYASEESKYYAGSRRGKGGAE